MAGAVLRASQLRDRRRLRRDDRGRRTAAQTTCCWRATCHPIDGSRRPCAS